MKQTHSLLIAAFAFLFFLPFSIRQAAASTELFNDWVQNGDTLSVDNISMNITFGEGGNSILVISAGFIQPVPLGSCRKQIPIEICYAEYDSVHSSDRPARIEIFRLEPFPKIFISAESASLIVGQEYDVTITLSNTGDYDIAEAKLTQMLPDSFKITRTHGCDSEGNAIGWEGNLKASSTLEHECEYSFVPQSDGTFETTAVLNYSDGYSQREKYSSTLKFKVSPIFSVSMSSNESSIDVGQKFRVTIIVKNDAQKRAILKELSVFIPHVFRITDASSYLSDTYKSRGTVLKWREESFASSDSKTAFIELMPARSGNFNILYKYNYEKGLDEYSHDLSAFQIEINKPEVKLASSISNNEELPSGSFQTFTLYVSNPSDTYNLTDINAQAESGLFFVQPARLSEVLPGGTRSIISTTFKVPEVNSSKVFKIRYNVTAATQYGEKLSESGSVQAKAVPIKKLILSSTVSASEAEEGKQIRITVRISNPNQVNYTNLKVKAFIPPALSAKGTTEASIAKLRAGEAEEALDFSVLMDHVTSVQEFNIIISLRYEDSGEIMIKKSHKITFSPPTPSVSATLSAESSSVHAGDFVPLSLNLRNNDERRVKNLKIYMFGNNRILFSQNIPSYAKRSPEITVLNPGETASLNFGFAVPTGSADLWSSSNIAAQSAVLGPASIEFEDEYGNTFKEQTNKITFSIKRNNLVFTPVQLSKKITSVERRKNGFLVSVLLEAKNPGSEISSDSITLNLYDASPEFAVSGRSPAYSELNAPIDEFTLLPGETRVIEYSVYVPFSEAESYYSAEPGKESGKLDFPAIDTAIEAVLSPAFAVYPAGLSQMTSFSDKPDDSLLKKLVKESSGARDMLLKADSEEKAHGEKSPEQNAGNPAGNEKESAVPSDEKQNTPPENKNEEMQSASGETPEEQEQSSLPVSENASLRGKEASESPSGKKSLLVSILEFIKKILFWKRSDFAGEPG